MLSDRVGRKRTMTYTILLYSICTGLSAFAHSGWELAACRFLAALGVGGEWAVASTLVAEEFPQRARAWAQSLFHASSTLGTYLAVAAGALIVADPRVSLHLPLAGGAWEISGWRLGFLLGALPALLILLTRKHLREPEVWRQTAEASGHGAGRQPAAGAGRQAAGPTGAGRLRDLFSAHLVRRTLVGVGLAGVGLATVWGTAIYGKDVLRNACAEQYLAALPDGADASARAALLEARAPELKRDEMLGMFLVTTGTGLGLLAFAPLAERLGRRGAMLLFLLGGLAAALVLFQCLTSVWAIALFLPCFGFLTVGLHAGFAVYFPELFPTRLRGTGAGFCFNAGRILAAPALFLAGWLQKDGGLSLAGSATLLSLLFPLGALLLLFAPETRGRELPD